MNDNEKYIEEFVNDIPFDAPEDKHRDELKKQLLNAFPKHRLQPTVHTVGVWRIIMKSTITRIAAAAVIIIAVFIRVHYLGGSIDGASVAWSQVVEQISSHTKYKYRQRVIWEQYPEYPAIQVYCNLNLQQKRQVHEDGTITIFDMRAEDVITLTLDPVQKKATVTKFIGLGPNSDPDIIDMVKRIEQEPTERLGTKKKDGKVLHGFRHLPNERDIFTVWVDADTKLPVEIERKRVNREQAIFMDEFDFELELDPSAFSTNVPDGYEVKTIVQDFSSVRPVEITSEHLRSRLNHTAYTLEKLTWIEKLIMIQAIDPFSSTRAARAVAYMIGIRADNGNMIIIAQGNHFDIDRMIWIPEQQLVLETPRGAKLYAHPNGAVYAQRFLESFAELKPEFFDIKNLSEERFTRMIVMPDGAIMGLSANKQMSHKKLQELVESLIEIKAN